MNYMKTKQVAITNSPIILTKGDWECLSKEEQENYTTTTHHPNCGTINGILIHLNSEQIKEFNKHRK